jgi:hypothetical protein
MHHYTCTLHLHSEANILIKKRAASFSHFLYDFSLLLRLLAQQSGSSYKPMEDLLFQYIYILILTAQILKSSNSAAGIAADYGLDDQEVGVRVLVGTRIFSSPCRPNLLW